MNHSDDHEAYLKGYDDAMRAATAGAAASPTAGMTTAVPASTSARKSRRDFGGNVGTAIGFAFGWLILAPLFIGLMGGSLYWVISDGSDFTMAAVAAGGVFFLFALFAGLVWVGWTLFINLWPLLIVAGIVAFIVSKRV